jgi:hypothetical protein
MEMTLCSRSASSIGSSSKRNAPRTQPSTTIPARQLLTSVLLVIKTHRTTIPNYTPKADAHTSRDPSSLPCVQSSRSLDSTRSFPLLHSTERHYSQKHACTVIATVERRVDGKGPKRASRSRCGALHAAGVPTAWICQSTWTTAVKRKTALAKNTQRVSDWIACERGINFGRGMAASVYPRHNASSGRRDEQGIYLFRHCIKL